VTAARAGLATPLVDTRLTLGASRRMVGHSRPQSPARVRRRPAETRIRGMFTPQARDVLVLAQEEAGLLEHDRVTTAHLLLGLFREPSGTAADILDIFDLDLDHTRAAVRRSIDRGPAPTPGELQLTTGAASALRAAAALARQAGSSTTGPEHILLGITEDIHSTAARVIADQGAVPGDIRAELLRRLTGPHRRDGLTTPDPHGSPGSDADADADIPHTASFYYNPGPQSSSSD
jgi:ATP-dependent Clp protease ATP-binding subunit ClpA